MIGSAIEVSADIFKDGHDLIAARILYRRPGEATSRVAPFNYRFDSDAGTARSRRIRSALAI